MLKIIFILLILIGTLGPNDGLVTAEEGNLITILGILLGLYVFISKPIYSLISKKRNNNTLNSKGKIPEDTNNMKKKYTDEFKKIVAKEANEGSKTLKELGEKYNINPTLVRNWKIQFQDQSSNTLPTEEEKKNIEKSSVSELNSLSITNIQTNLSLDDDLDTIKNALNISKSFIEQAKNNIKQGILTDKYDNLESAENYLTDGFSLIQAKSWLDVELALKASLTDAMVMIEDDAYEEGYEDPADSITYLKEKYDNHTAFIKSLVVNNFFYNAGYEFENLDWNESDKLEVPSEEKKNIEKSSVSELNSLSITNIQTNLSLDDDLDTIKNTLNVSKSFIEQAKNNIKQGILTDQHDRLESAENYISDGFSLIQAKSWLDVELALKASLTDPLVMIEEEAYEEGYEDPADSITYLKEKHGNHTVFIKSFVIDYFLYNAGYEFENLEWDESDKLEVPSAEAEPNNDLWSLSINSIVNFLSITEDSSKLKENIDKAQQCVNEAKIKVSEGSLGDESNSLESAQNYLNDAYSLIKAKNWDEIILSLQNSQTDAMKMLSEEADSEDSDDILSYLQDLHETYEACVFDITVYNFLYNAGAEFESLQWDENDKQEVTSNEIETKSAEVSNAPDSQSINNIVQFLGDLDNNSQLKENIDKAQQCVNEAKIKVSEGSLGDESNSLESAQNYLNDAYSLIKAKNWDEIILSLQNSQTDAMKMLSEEADSEDSDDILSYLQDLHETYEACVFDITVYNFLYNAGAEFESLQW